MSAELEVELDLHRCAGLRAIRANRIARSARRRHAVQRPRDRLEHRRLAGAVRPDDARDPRLEIDSGVDVLPEIAEMQAD